MNYFIVKKSDYNSLENKDSKTVFNSFFGTEPIFKVDVVSQGEYLLQKVDDYYYVAFHYYLKSGKKIFAECESKDIENIDYELRPLIYQYSPDLEELFLPDIDDCIVTGASKFLHSLVDVTDVYDEDFIENMKHTDIVTMGAKLETENCLSIVTAIVIEEGWEFDLASFFNTEKESWYENIRK